MWKHRNIILFGLCIAVIAIYTFLQFKILENSSNSKEPNASIESKLPTPEKDVSKLLETDQSPKIVKCNFTGTYQVVQDYVLTKNGAKCNEFETRKITYDNVITACSGFLDPRQELFLNCDYNNNLVRNCTGVTSVKVEGGIAACEYWVTIKKID